MARKAVFLDRDGTIIEDPGYLSDPDEVTLLPGVELAIKSLSQAGYLVVVVTNQSGIARGMFTEETLDLIHDRLRELLHEKGARIDGMYYCPFLPEGSVEQYAVESDLRKPKPGMLLEAADELDIDLQRSWMVGDSPRDIEAGQRAGTRTIRLRLPKAEPRKDSADTPQADFIVRNLVDAARVIIREEKRRDDPQAVQAGAPVPKRDAVVATAMQLASEQPDSPSATDPEERDPADPPADTATDAPKTGTSKQGVSRLGLQSEEKDASSESRSADAVPVRPVESGAAGPSAAALQRIQQQLQQLINAQGVEEEFSITKMLAGIVQMLVVLALAAAVYAGYQGRMDVGTFWAVIAAALQGMALTLYVMNRLR
ncbi:MAG: D-glycero-alpha-D-manno-heptose-1,7-bisphosphate 7-phosphatase [Phycisphaerae bacterium]